MNSLTIALFFQTGQRLGMIWRLRSSSTTLPNRTAMTDDKALESENLNHQNDRGERDEDAISGVKQDISGNEVIPPELLEQVPEEHRDELIRAFHLVQVEKTSFFRGPLPSPAILKEYEDILPGSADRIITMTEKQQQHRMSIESAVIQSDIWMERLGLGAGFVLAMTLALGGIWLVSEGKEITGLAMLVSQIVLLVGAFFYAKRLRQRELDERKKNLEEGPREASVPPD